MKIPVITGPTASGKSSIAFEVAKNLGSIEIISADAFQVYRYMDIGTAKADISEREEVKHHLIDVMDPDECYSAGIFAESAEKIIEDIISRGKYPVIAGGTGLYIKSLTEGIFNCPEIDISYRERLQERVLSEGLQSLYNELKEIDYEYACKISSNDPARIVRALEVYYGLGISFSEAHKKYNRAPKYSYKVMMLNMDRQILYNKINERTELMWQMGWKSEVEKLLNMGYSASCPGFRAIGYRLISDLIINGGSEDFVKKEIAKETRHFAKRQLTWFRHSDNINLYDDRNHLMDDLLLSISGRGL